MTKAIQDVPDGNDLFAIQKAKSERKEAKALNKDGIPPQGPILNGKDQHCFDNGLSLLWRSI